MSRPLRIAALVKQIPKIETMELGPDGRLVRDGLEMHMNDYCRRAVRKGCDLAEQTGGSCVAITLGPPVAENVLREAILCGCSHGYLVSDPAFGGSDTWATAAALAGAAQAVGPFDLILMGRNSVDADTGQVPPQLAEMLGLPFATGARHLDLDDDLVMVRLEHDDEWVDATIGLPAIVSCAERLCDPCKIKDPVAWATVDAALITHLDAATIGPGPWGQEASPTQVGAIRELAVDRAQIMATGNLDDQVSQVMAVLGDRDALVPVDDDPGQVPPPVTTTSAAPVIVLVEPDRPRLTRQLLGAGADLAATFGSAVIAAGPGLGDPTDLGRWGADSCFDLTGSTVEEDLAHALQARFEVDPPSALIAPSTAWGREIASRLAAVFAAGLTGDAVGLVARDGRLVAMKPAFGGRLVAEIMCSSPIQMATVRAGVLAVAAPRVGPMPVVEQVPVAATSRLTVSSRTRDDDSGAMATADIVIGVGQGVDPSDYPVLDRMRQSLGAEFCATRKVTDQGWMPRARQVGITGHSLAPQLYIAIGLSGKFNHTVGVRSSGTIVAINPDPDAMVFDCSDVGVVGDWKPVLEALVPRIVAEMQASAS